MTLEDLARRMELLEAEVRTLRRVRVRADGDAIEALLCYLHDSLNSREWTAADVLAEAADHPLLLGATKRCLGKRITLKKLSHLLGDAVGVWGEYRLDCAVDHSRYGRLFTVTKIVTSSRINDGTVKTSRRSHEL